MIVPMEKVRLLGPGGRLAETLRAVQDVGVLHLTPPAPRPQLEALAPQGPERRRQRQLESALADAEAAIKGLGIEGHLPAPAPVTVHDLAVWARDAGDIRRRTDALLARRAALDEERALLARYKDLFAALESLMSARALIPGASAYHVVLRKDQAASLGPLRQGLRELIGDAFELLSRALPSGETALLLLVPQSEAPRVDALLAETRVQEMPVPHGYGETLEEAVPRMRARGAALPAEFTALDGETRRLGTEHGATLLRARTAFRDELARLAARPLSGVTPHAFVLEGWLPVATEPRLRAALDAALGDDIVLERLSREEWRGEDVPVILRNPRLFRPFEVITRTLPLPRYGTLDPTPYVGVFFPMFFGLMLGDIGYGLAAGLLALVIRRRTAPESTGRMVAEVLGACAAFSVAFGIAFGELFGDLGRRWLGLRPLVLDREAALIPFLALAVALGAVHVVLGLVLGAVGQRRAHPRAALGRGLSAAMVVLILVALLAAVEVLPRGLMTPAATAVLVAFPVLIVLEGIVGPVELLTNIGHILSYARIMALGTASVMLAVVANQLAGAIGSAVVGVVFALLFHLVNFALGLFSPAIHALRLHYVEFFGTFYSPGGTRYQPLGHWTPTAGKPA